MLSQRNKKYFLIIRNIIAVTALISVLLYAFTPKPDITHHVSYSTAYYDADETLLRLNLATDERYRLWTPIEN